MVLTPLSWPPSLPDSSAVRFAPSVVAFKRTERRRVVMWNIPARSHTISVRNTPKCSEHPSFSSWSFRGMVAKDQTGQRGRFYSEKYAAVRSLRGNEVLIRIDTPVLSLKPEEPEPPQQGGRRRTMKNSSPLPVIIDMPDTDDPYHVCPRHRAYTEYDEETTRPLYRLVNGRPTTFLC